MLLRRIALKNIRSYNDGEEAAFNIPEGVILFEGDIGSGKSTILYALEFALFGFGDLKGQHILSEGRQTGKVSVTFDSGGTEYTVDRHLRTKGKEVVQDECFISSQGERTKLSTSDLKERIISILGFNEPTHPKAESLVYRYAVFTPQEQMKEILVQKPDERMNVIRRILGVQSYQLAAENSETLEKSIREISHVLRRAGEDLSEKNEELEATRRGIARLEADLPGLKQSSFDASKLVVSLDSELKEYVGQREAISRAESLIPRLRQDVSDLKDEVADYHQSLADLEARLSGELEPVVKAFESMAKPRQTSKETQARLDAARETLTQLHDTKSALQKDLERTRDLASKGVCPLCGQKVVGSIIERSEHAEREISETDEKLKDSTALVAGLTAELEESREYEDVEAGCARAAKEIQRVDADIMTTRKKLQVATGKLARSGVELQEASNVVSSMREVSAKVADLDRRLADARAEDKRSSLVLNQAESDHASKLKDRDRLGTEVAKMQAAVDESVRLGKYQTWLSGFFRPAVRTIETQTLTQAASRFNEHFQRFFTSLVEDPDMVVRVKEDFTPVFEREGFEQDYEALSGGERTSMALAYRFALNSVVRESILAQPELVILDEPTDGFSKEQVYKMRGLLEQLDSRQVILVSHEKELESMADHIFRVEKRNGNSTITKA